MAMVPAARIGRHAAAGNQPTAVTKRYNQLRSDVTAAYTREGRGTAKAVTGNRDAASDTPDGAGRHHDDLIRLGAWMARSPGGGRPLAMEFEARVATGKAGERLALEQSAAICEVLSWIASNRETGDNAHDQAGS